MGCYDNDDFDDFYQDYDSDDNDNDDDDGDAGDAGVEDKAIEDRRRADRWTAHGSRCPASILQCWTVFNTAILGRVGFNTSILQCQMGFDAAILG